MRKVLLGMVWLCCLAAAAGVTAAVTGQIVTKDLTAGNTAVAPEPVAEASPVVVAVVVETVAVAEPVEAAPTTVEAQVDRPTAEEQFAGALELATTDPKVFVAGLSTEQRQKLMKVFLERRLVDIRRQNSYTLPTDYRLSTMERAQGGRLALSEDQKLRLKGIREAFRGRIDGAINDLRNRDEDVRRRIREKAEEYGPEGQAEHADEFKALQKEWADVRREANGAKGEIDTDYEAAVDEILTPEQSEALADIPPPPGLLNVGDRP